MNLQNRVCVVTGGGSGIGAAGVRSFARAGARVVVADRNGEAAAAVAAETGGVAVTVDVGDERSVDGLVAETLTRHGRIDVLWANAGIAGDSAPCAEQPTEAWSEVLRVNLTGVFFSLRAALHPMLEAGRGVLLATASVSGLQASAGSPAYHVAKAGVIMLVRHVARAYGARGIRCNALCPGLTDTPILDPFALRSAAATRSLRAPSSRSQRGRSTQRHRGGGALPRERRGVVRERRRVPSGRRDARLTGPGQARFSSLTLDPDNVATNGVTFSLRKGGVLVDAPGSAAKW